MYPNKKSLFTLLLFLIIGCIQWNPSMSFSLSISPSPSASSSQLQRSCSSSLPPLPRPHPYPRHTRIHSRIHSTTSTSNSRTSESESESGNEIKIEAKFDMSRKNWLSSIIHGCTVAAGATLPISSNAAETIGKDPECNDPTCLGVWDGLLADCPHGIFTIKSGAGCASSQDDTPGVFAEPWDYSEAPNNTLDYEEQMRLLIPAIQLVSSRRGDKAILLNQNGRYLRFLFVDGKTNEESIGEFYFTPNDSTVQFRVGSSSSTLSSTSGGNKSGIAVGSTRNLERCELIRKELRYQKVPVLRNRKRALFFVESDFDTFGPSLGAAGEDIDAKMNIDDYPTELLQNFPSSSGITGRGRR